MNRAQTGFTLAGLTLTAAVLVTKSVLWRDAFVAVTVLALLATFANRLPLLHRLPRLGAPKVEVITTLEGRNVLSAAIRRLPPLPVPEYMKEMLEMDFERGALEARDLHIQIGLKKAGRGVLRDVIVTFMHPEGLSHRETDPYGESADHGVWMPPTSESLMAGEDGQPVFSDYWVLRLDLQPGSTLLHFRLRVPRAGRWPVRVKVTAPDLYSDVVADQTIVVEEVEADALRSHDRLSYAIQETEALRTDVRADSVVDFNALVASVMKMSESVTSEREDLAKLITSAPISHSGPKTGWEYDRALLTAKLHAAYDARRRLGTSAS